MNWNLLIWFAAEVALALVAALLVRRYLLFMVYVKGRSMRPTLQGGEIMFALRYRKKRGVRRGDVVICRFPELKQLLVKRVVGMPGETIRMEAGEIYVDEAPLEEPYAKKSVWQKMEARQIGEGEYFVLGDNRTASRDSRRLGAIREENLLGRGAYVLFPLKSRRKLATRG